MIRLRDKILIHDDKNQFLELSPLLEERLRCEVHWAESTEEADQMIQEKGIGLLISNSSRYLGGIPGTFNGYLDFLEKIKSENIKVLLLSNLSQYSLTSKGVIESEHYDVLKDERTELGELLGTIEELYQS